MKFLKSMIVLVSLTLTFSSCNDRKIHPFKRRSNPSAEKNKSIDDQFKQKIVGTFMKVQDNEDAYAESYMIFNADGTGVQELYITQYDDNGEALEPVEGTMDFNYTIKDGHLSLKIGEVNSNNDEILELLQKAADMQAPLKIAELSTQRLIVQLNNQKTVYVRKVE